MNKKSIIVASLLLMSLGAISLGLSSKKYNNVEASANKGDTIYLYCPNEVTRTDGTDALTWDKDDLVYVNLYEAGVSKPYRKMTKVKDHLYAYKVENDTARTKLEFYACVDGNEYCSRAGLTDYPISSMDFSTQNMFTLLHYSCYTPADAYEVGFYNDADAASDVASGFISDIRSACAWNHTDTDVESLKTAWVKYNDILAQLPDGVKTILKNADSGEDTTLGNFAALYDVVYARYHSSYSSSITDFADRTSGGLGLVNTANNVTSEDKNITPIIIIALGISISSISIFIYKLSKKDR